MKDNDIVKIGDSGDIKVKDLKIDNFNYVVFCYDKNPDCMDLYVISIYKKLI